MRADDPGHRRSTARLRRGEACGETCALLYTYSAEWVRKCTLTGAVAVRNPANTQAPSARSGT